MSHKVRKVSRREVLAARPKDGKFCELWQRWEKFCPTTTPKDKPNKKDSDACKKCLAEENSSKD